MTDKQLEYELLPLFQKVFSYQVDMIVFQGSLVEEYARKAIERQVEEIEVLVREHYKIDPFKSVQGFAFSCSLDDSVSSDSKAIFDKLLSMYNSIDSFLIFVPPSI